MELNFHICFNRSIRLSIDGWVANKLPLFLRFFFNGTSIYMEAVAEFALSTSRGSPLIFLKAFIKPTGLRVNSTAVVSARYSRFLETASWTNCAATGAKMTKTRAIMAIGGLCFLIQLLVRPRP